jgi:molecular chaperone GrpE (heat shock protein)
MSKHSKVARAQALIRSVRRRKAKERAAVAYLALRDLADKVVEVAEWMDAHPEYVWTTADSAQLRSSLERTIMRIRITQKELGMYLPNGEVAEK